jgi:hypothetical protein
VFVFVAVDVVVTAAVLADSAILYYTVRRSMYR